MIRNIIRDVVRDAVVPIEGWAGGGDLGPELVIDGDFPDNTNWTEGTGWIIGSDVATHTGAGGRIQSSANLGTTAALIYRVVFTVTNIDNNWVKVDSAGFVAAEGVQRVAAGTYTEDFTCSGNTFVAFYANSTNVSITNVSVKQVL